MSDKAPQFLVCGVGPNGCVQVEESCPDRATADRAYQGFSDVLDVPVVAYRLCDPAELRPGVSQPLSLIPAESRSEGTDELDGLALIVARLSRLYTDKEVLDWLHRPHPQLGGRSAQDLIREGDVAPVLAITSRLNTDGFI